jgi:hypothetical protein
MIEQAQKVLNSVHKRLHAAQAEEFELLVECFRENPDSFWMKQRKPAYPWDEKTFLDALDNYYFVPVADPNTSSQTQRLMKVLALKQLQSANPALYDPIAVEMAALQSLGWSNPQQFMAPASAQQKPPPELIQAMAKMQNESKEADARMLDAQTRAAESQAKLELEQARLQNESGQGAVDQEKMASLQVQQAEIEQRHTDTVLDAINRKRDRESRERLAAIKLAEEAMRNPQGLGVAQQFLDPNMLQRLEAVEPTLDGTKTGEL